MKNINYILVLILIVSLISRLFSIYFYGDTHVDNEWGVILSNLENHGILGYRESEGVVFQLFIPHLYIHFFILYKNFFYRPTFFHKNCITHSNDFINFIYIRFFLQNFKKYVF